MRTLVTTDLVRVRAAQGVEMQRFGIVLALAVVVALAGLVGWSAPPAVTAQEATPASEEMAPEGITFDPLGVAPGVIAPAPTDLVLVRIGFEPGAVLPSDPSDLDGAMAIVESGTLTLRLETPLIVSRAGSFAAAIATAEATGEFTTGGEAVASGEEITLAPGDVVYVPGGVGGEIRNDGAERAEVLVFLLTPGTEQMGEVATPAA
jgi:quercetin dioxygenase-like cupin family protein